MVTEHIMFLGQHPEVIQGENLYLPDVPSNQIMGVCEMKVLTFSLNIFIYLVLLFLFRVIGTPSLHFYPRRLWCRRSCYGSPPPGRHQTNMGCVCVCVYVSSHEASERRCMMYFGGRGICVLACFRVSVGLGCVEMENGNIKRNGRERALGTVGRTSVLI